MLCVRRVKRDLEANASVVIVWRVDSKISTNAISIVQNSLANLSQLYIAIDIDGFSGTSTTDFLQRTIAVAQLEPQSVSISMEEEVETPTLEATVESTNQEIIVPLQSKTRMRYSREIKLTILDTIASGIISQAKLAKQLSESPPPSKYRKHNWQLYVDLEISPSLFTKWRQSRERIEAYKPKAYRSKRGKASETIYKRLDSALFVKWIEAGGYASSATKHCQWYIDNAKELFEKLFPEKVAIADDGNTKTYGPLVIDDYWAHSYMRRNGILYEDKNDDTGALGEAAESTGAEDDLEGVYRAAEAD